MEYSSTDGKVEKDVSPQEEHKRILGEIRDGVKKHDLAAFMAVALGAASADLHRLPAAEPIVVKLEQGQDLNKMARMALIESLATIPDMDVKETWLPLVTKDKMRVKFYEQTRDISALATFSVIEEGGKFVPQLKIVAPYVMVMDKKKTWSVLKHEFTHYQQWMSGFAKNEEFFENRALGTDTWQEQLRILVDGEVQARLEEMKFLDAVQYDGTHYGDREDIDYREWKTKGPRAVIDQVRKFVSQQVAKDPRMVAHVEMLAGMHLLKEKK